METKEKIIALLLSTKRTGVDNLIDYLVREGFFEAPASTRFHGCYKGGLADHSYNVYELLKENCPPTITEITGMGQKPLMKDEYTCIIAALLHDVCKIGAYFGDSYPYKWNKSQPKGHALLSISRIKEYIELSELEEMMIKYHMGVYGLIEFDERSGEYSLRGNQGLSKEEKYGKSLANAWYHNPICKIMYFCDELETLNEKIAESSPA